MAGSLNKVTIIGNVGRDPEIRTTQDGREVANFSVATSDIWKDKATGERRDRTEWHRVVVFSQHLVNLIKNYVHKGSKVYLEGALQTRKWTDQNTNSEKYTTEIVLQQYSGTLMMLDGRGENNDQAMPGEMKKNGTNNAPSFSNGQNNIEVEDIDDEIPF